ncbi:ribonuclease domain-containing protein [Candidatus Xianfuyuplasma coldseepsis]|uniref:Uncharacterized protein n=1 Tax=Candidatus Xianfuyuplasma coldseepsis TaxID=2782163 RepID=A0A7L7KRD0_9MOLU|nr:ribonuclease domain-containing protein [Xianfuyuplasma coldseepsis]QMS84832.1 hypothetical protein G4Z02_03375 [Xianfuyuplasma coldseepsis]
MNARRYKTYTDYDHVAMYILEYDELPSNYVPKSQGVAPGEYDVTVYAVYDNTRDPVLLPDGYSYTEAYINATTDDVGAERFVFSSEQLFYTNDHYASFIEVTRWDLLGSHYIFLSFFWISITGSGVVTIVLVRKGYLTLDVIKTDVKQDFLVLQNIVKVTIKKIKSPKKSNTENTDDTVQ